MQKRIIDYYHRSYKVSLKSSYSNCCSAKTVNQNKCVMCVTSKCDVCNGVHFCQFHHSIVVVKIGQRSNQATSD